MAGATRKEGPRPTKAELEILGVLWERAGATVRQVHEVLDARRATGYTTVLKLMQIMAAKGLVARDEDARAHVYTAVPRKEDTRAQLIDELLNAAFGGSAGQLVLHALSRRKASRAELAEIRRLLDRVEGRP